MSERGSEGRVLPKRIITPTPRDRDVESASLQPSGSHRPHLGPKPITGNRRHGKASAPTRRTLQSIPQSELKLLLRLWQS